MIANYLYYKCFVCVFEIDLILIVVVGERENFKSKSVQNVDFDIIKVFSKVQATKKTKRNERECHLGDL